MYFLISYIWKAGKAMGLNEITYRVSINKPRTKVQDNIWI